MGAPPEVDGGGLATSPLATEAAGEPRDASLYQGARREIDFLLRGMQEQEAGDRAAEGQPRSWRQAVSPRMLLILLVSLACAAWIATRLTTQAVLHRRIERETDRIAQRIEAYRSKTNLYPDRETWLQWTTGSDAASFLDPWQRPYLYDLDSHAFSLTTHGADGRVGGSGDDADRTFVFTYTNRRLALPRAQTQRQPASR